MKSRSDDVGSDDGMLTTEAVLFEPVEGEDFMGSSSVTFQALRALVGGGKDSFIAASLCLIT